MSTPVSSLLPRSFIMALAAASLTLSGCGKTTPDAKAGAADAGGDDAVARGRYLIAVGGCNDCHTPDFMVKGPAIPEADRLTGVALGWRGPWGTSYGSNLRLTVPAYDADNWIKMIRTRNGLPPMPWASMHAMTDSDLRAVHAYISSLGAAGEPTPPPLPPDAEPKTPWLNMTPVMP